MIKLKKLVSQKQNQGFTLIELLFATVILGTMITLTMITFIGVFRFYIWSRTTRNNQIAARQVMETMTREIDANAVIGLGDDNRRICLKDPTTGNGKKIGLLSSTNGVLGAEFTFAGATASATTIYSQKFQITIVNNKPGCNIPEAGSTATAISNANMKVSELKFNFINTSINSTYPSLNPAQFRESTTIDMTVVNGGVITTGPDTGKCKVGDNFCDVASYSTAVTGR